MHDFKYVNDELYCEGVPVSRIAEEVGTPFYLYSARTLTNHYRVFDRAFSGLRHIICYSVKANSNVAILKLLIKEGAGVDIVSGGELYRALQAGVEPGKVVYSGVGKRVDEIEFALATDILMFNIESSEELMMIDRCAGRMKKKARIAVRINPDVDPRTHPHISTGLKENKFGVNIEKSLETYRWARTLGNIEVTRVGLSYRFTGYPGRAVCRCAEKTEKLIGLLEKRIYISGIWTLEAVSGSPMTRSFRLTRKNTPGPSKKWSRTPTSPLFWSRAG